MDQFEIVAEPRAELGKGAMRRLRRTGFVPAVVYGAGADPMTLKLHGHTVRRQLENEAFFSHILTLKIGGEESQVVVKDLQRDPTTSQVIHMDLLRVSSTQEITMNVPLHFVNEEDSPGRQHGGVFSRLMVDVEISCLPKDLPEYIDVEMSGLDVGDSLHLSDLIMPAGVTLLALAHDEEGSHDQAVVSVQHPQKLEEETEGEEAEEGIDAEVPGAPSAEGDGSSDEEG
jgi:large subunit ribosomal protein L25